MALSLTNPTTVFVVDLLINVLVKGTIVLAVAGLGAWLLRGKSAALRHAVWSIALGTLLALPSLEATLPAWKLDPLYVSVASENGSFGDAGMSPSEAGDFPACDCECGCSEGGDVAALKAGDRPGGVFDGQTAASSGTPAQTGTRGSTAAGVALFLWVLGATALLSRLGLDVFRVRGLTQRAGPWGSRRERDLASLFAVNLGIRRRMRFLESGELSAPVAWGLRVPTVIFPANAADWTSERKRLVLLHELAHIQRWDYAVHLMVQIVCAVYWFNPLVWLAARFNGLEQERACDDRALRVGVRSDVYAEHLLEIARAQVGAPAPRGAFAMARSSGLAGSGPEHLGARNGSSADHAAPPVVQLGGGPGDSNPAGERRDLGHDGRRAVSLGSGWAGGAARP